MTSANGRDLGRGHTLCGGDCGVGVQLVGGLVVRSDGQQGDLLRGFGKALEVGDRVDHVVVGLADAGLVDEHAPRAQQRAVICGRFEAGEAVFDLATVAFL